MTDTLVGIVRQTQSKYYGKYRATVADNQDPNKTGRLKLKVPSVLAETETDWALPCFPYGGVTDVGIYLIPDVGAEVWAEFEEGDLSHPVWVGSFWSSGGTDLGKPEVKTFKTTGGHLLQFDETEDAPKTILRHPKGAEVLIDEKGGITLTDASGGVVQLDAENSKLVARDANRNTVTMSSSGVVVEDGSGNKIEMASSGVTVKGQRVVVDATQVSLGGSAGEPVIKGQSFLTAYLTHTHPTGVGPSGPPIPTGEPTSLSTKVMTG